MSLAKFKKALLTRINQEYAHRLKTLADTAGDKPVRDATHRGAMEAMKSFPDWIEDAEREARIDAGEKPPAGPGLVEDEYDA